MPCRIVRSHVFKQTKNFSPTFLKNDTYRSIIKKTTPECQMKQTLIRKMIVLHAFGQKSEVSTVWLASREVLGF